MALIKLTAIVDNISGKLNGTVFARNKGGHYMRSKSNPTNPRTVAQQAVRAAFGAIAQLWRGLTKAQRDAWNSASGDFPYQNKLGDTRVLSGFALHQKLNRNLQLADQPAIQSPPVPAAVPAPTVLSVNPSIAGNLTMTGEFSIDMEPEATVIIFATPPLSPGVNNYGNRLRFITSAGQVEVEDGFKTLQSYNRTFGTPNEGAKIGYRIYAINPTTGQESAPLDAEIIVTA